MFVFYIYLIFFFRLNFVQKRYDDGTCVIVVVQRVAFDNSRVDVCIDSICKSDVD